jgi:O-succinylbenzoic acid--CoA ligase
MPAADECDLVAVVGRGEEISSAAIAAWDAGEAVLPINPDLTRPELDELFEHLRPTVVNGDRQRDGIPVPSGTAAVMVTSGTAGAPKGVELTTAGMDVMGRGYSAGLEAGAGDRWLACLPLHHVASLAVIARAYVTGVPFTVHDGFELGRVAEAPRREGASIVSLVPTTLRRLLDASAPLHEFRRVIVGGAPCPPGLRARAEATGAVVVDAYGLSETWGGFALDRVPIAGAEVRLADETREILVRGAIVMRRYRRDAERTDEVLDADGWLHTGDVGRRDESGGVEVVDRLRDLVITGGINVSPTEVEAVLVEHPSVADVCVIGVPDDEWGERVVAVVVPVDAASPPTVEVLRNFARARLSAPKLPREIKLTAQIPRSNSGKPLRRVLRGTP